MKRFELSWRMGAFGSDESTWNSSLFPALLKQFSTGLYVFNI
jgi:hypothetical protein